MEKKNQLISHPYGGKNNRTEKFHFFTPVLSRPATWAALTLKNLAITLVVLVPCMAIPGFR